MPTAPQPDDVRQLLRGVVDPELNCDIVELGMVSDVRVDGGNVAITIALTTAGCPLKAQIKRDVESRIQTAPGVTSVALDWREMTQEEKATCMAVARKAATERAVVTDIPATAKVIAIASGKGGVGKSSITVNMAVFAPIPKASVSTASAANPGFFAICRTANRIL